MQTERIKKTIEDIADEESAKYEIRLSNEKRTAPQSYISDLEGFIRGIYHLKFKLLKAFEESDR